MQPAPAYALFRMATQTMLRDIGELYARLLDHRPVMHSEINYFVREFEETRGDREQNRLQSSLEYSRETAEKLIPDSVTQMSTSIPALAEKVKEASELCNLILDNEENWYQEDRLQEQRSERSKKWSKFMDDMCEKSAAVDREFADEVERLKSYYDYLEQKLNISESPKK